MSATPVSFPLRLDGSGDAARARGRAAGVEELIEELLFTGLGERLNRPTLGCGLLELVFDPATDELRAATQFQVTAALQRWLGDLIRVTAVTIEPTRPAQLTVTVSYTLIADGAQHTAVFSR